jgi:hypothetical protein
MRATEFIDFLNRKSLDGIELYSHLEVREKNEDGKMVLKEKYKRIRKEYRSMIKKENSNE